MASSTCFCASMRSGPAVTSGFDLALTAIVHATQHYFLVAVGSNTGAEVLSAIPYRVASGEERASAERVVARAAGQMGRSLNITGLKELLYQSADHPHWDAIARRCLACANSTLDCPTCFCTSTMVNVGSVLELTIAHQLADVPMILVGVRPCFSCNDRMVSIRRTGNPDVRTWKKLRQYGIDHYRGSTERMNT